MVENQMCVAESKIFFWPRIRPRSAHANIDMPGRALAKRAALSAELLAIQAVFLQSQKSKFTNSLLSLQLLRYRSMYALQVI